MSLAIVGQEASYEVRWRYWALLSDTITAVLEAGVPGSRYPRVHSIGSALVEGSIEIAADGLAQELRAIRLGLQGHALDGLMVSPRTAAVLYPGAHLEASRPLNAFEMRQIAPPGQAKDLADYFAFLLDSIEHVCASPKSGGQIEVVDG